MIDLNKLPPLIPRKVLFGEPEKLYPQISPNGKILSYLAPHNGVLNIWIKTIGKDDDRPITDEKKRGIRFYFWSYDNETILYIQDSDGDENWHLYGVNIKTGLIRDYTPFKGIKMAEHIAMEPEFPDKILIPLNIRNRSLFDVYSLNLKTGAIKLVEENPGDVSGLTIPGGWLIDHNLKVRACTSMKEDGSVELRIKKGKKWKTFIVWSIEDSFSSPIAFTPDNKKLYIVDSRDSDTSYIAEVDLNTGEKNKLLHDPEYDIDYSPDYFLFHPKTKKLQAVCYLKVYQEWKILDKEIEKDMEFLNNFHRGIPFILSRDIEDKVWLIVYNCDNEPRKYYLYERDKKKINFLFSSRPELEKYKLSEMKPFKIKARDGLTLHGYITFPLGVEPKNLPMVVFPHGGPYYRDFWGYNGEVQWLSNRGYVVLQVNFRGSIGYGKNFVNAGDKEWGGKMHDDVIDVVNWAIKEGIADPKKIAIYGGSYGGYEALVGATFTPDVFCCAISVCGPSNLITFINSIPPYWKPIRSLFTKRIGDPEKEEEFLKSRSPLFKVDNLKIPLLIAHGANDPRVKKEESEQIVEAARKKGIDVEYILFPDEGHGLINPENRLKFVEIAEKFLAKHLGGRFEE
ncbi:MAG: S9 family peptidase [candidate division WOR-3 bacterium]